MYRKLLQTLVVLTDYTVYTWSRMLLPVVLVEVMMEFDLDIGLAGLLTTLNGVGQGLLSLFAGYVIDRIGYLRGLLIGIAITAVASLITSLSVTSIELFAAAIISGLGIAFWTASSYPLLGKVLDNRLNLSSGLIVSAFGLGMFTAPTLATYVIQLLGGWRGVFLFLFVISVFLILLSEILLVGVKASSHNEGVQISLQVFMQFFKFIPPISCFAFMQFAYLALYVSYLRLAHGFESGAAAFAISPYGLGVLVGGLLSTYLGSKFRRSWLTSTSSTIAAVLMLFIFNTVPSLISASLVSLFFGVVLGGIMFQTMIVDIQTSVPKEYLASATGFFYTVVSFASIPSGYVLGSMVSYMGWQTAGTVFYILTTMTIWLWSTIIHFKNPLERKNH